MRCEGLKKKNGHLEICGREIEGRDLFRHDKHILCQECCLNLRYSGGDRKWMFYLHSLGYNQTYVDVYDYEIKITQLMRREK